MQHVTYSYQDCNILVKLTKRCENNKYESNWHATYVKFVYNSIHNDHNAIVEI